MRTDVYRDRQTYAVADKTCNRGRNRQDSQTSSGKAKAESDSGRQTYKTKPCDRHTNKTEHKDHVKRDEIHFKRGYTI